MLSSRHNPCRDSETGFVLLAVICLLVLLLIALAVAAPKVAQSIQRDKEMEAIHRGEQYREAIKEYYTHFHAYPTSVKQLLSSNNMRFLRQQYTDPLTGKDDWKPICYGHAHVRPLGFFGKPLSAIGGIAAAGVGAASGGMYAVTTSTNASGDSTSDNSGDDSSDDGFGDSDSGFGNSSAGNNTQSAFGSSSGGMFSGQSGFGSSGMGSSGLGSTSPTSTTTTTFGASSGTSATGFGGSCPIVGFTLPINKPSLIDYMEQDSYNKWEFNYDPMADQLQQSVSLLGGGGNMNDSSDATTANPFGGSNPSSGSTSTNAGTGTGTGTNTGGSSIFGNNTSNSGTSSPNSPQ